MDDGPYNPFPLLCEPLETKKSHSSGAHQNCAPDSIQTWVILGKSTIDSPDTQYPVSDPSSLLHLAGRRLRGNCASAGSRRPLWRDRRICEPANPRDWVCAWPSAHNAARAHNMVMRQAGWLTLLGISIGLVCAVGASMAMGKLLFGVQAWDAATLATVVATSEDLQPPASCQRIALLQSIPPKPPPSDPQLILICIISRIAHRLNSGVTEEAWGSSPTNKFPSTSGALAPEESLNKTAVDPRAGNTEIQIVQAPNRLSHNLAKHVPIIRGQRQNAFFFIQLIFVEPRP